MPKLWPEIILVIKFAMEILREHHLVKDLQTKHKLNLYEALKSAKNTAQKEHENAKKMGGQGMAEDSNDLLNDTNDLFFGDDADKVASRGED